MTTPNGFSRPRIHATLTTFEARVFDPALVWDTDVDAEETALIATVGQIALDVFPTRTPVGWAVRCLTTEGYEEEEDRDADDGLPTEITGTAHDVDTAKDAARHATLDLIPRILHFILLRKA